MTTLTDWLDQADARVAAAHPAPWAYTVRADGRAWVDMPDIDGHALGLHGFGHDAVLIAHARTDLPAAIAALRAVLSEDAARRIVAMNHQVTPEELTSDDLWLVQEVEAILAAVAAASLGVTS